MALFPDADFEVFLREPGVVVPGTRLEGTLQIRVPAPIPRAQAIDLFFRTTASATYGSGEDEHTTTKDLFVFPFHATLDKRTPLPAGPYDYPFSFDVPPWLPPALEGTGCSIRHRIEARLDVDWAKDPTKTFTPKVAPPPQDLAGEPLVLRSPKGWHPELVVDIKLENGTPVAGEPLVFELALRSGRDARFDALDISVEGEAVIVMGRRETRRTKSRTARLLASQLRSGDAVRFRMDYPTGLPPTFRTGYIDHNVILGVKAVVPWGRDPAFYLKLHMLPEGSIVRGAKDPRSLGSDRLARIGAAVAEKTGLARGPVPVLAEGKVGPIRLRISDSPRSGRMGLDVNFGLPDLDLGIVFRPLGALERFRESPLLPEALKPGIYLLRVDENASGTGLLAMPVPYAALERLFTELLAYLLPDNEIRLSDHHLGVHLVLREDTAQEIVECAQWAKTRAEALARAIEAMPFAAILPDAEAAWRATAREQNAFLVPHIPSLHGLVVATRVLGGDLRELGVTLRTKRDRTISADVDLRDAPLPSPAIAQLEQEQRQEQGSIEALAPVRALFPRCRVHSAEKLTLEGATFVSDPRSLLSVLDAFLGWLLDVRGERRAQSAYR